MEVICQSSFLSCAALRSISFGSVSKLSRIECAGFHRSGLTWIDFPASVEVICDSSFADCFRIQSIIFACDSKLSRIECDAFFGDHRAAFIEGGHKVWIECTNCRFPKIHFDLKLMGSPQSPVRWNRLTEIHLPASVEMICEWTFGYCLSLQSVTFASDSKLSRIECGAFWRT